MTRSHDRKRLAATLGAILLVGAPPSAWGGPPTGRPEGGTAAASRVVRVVGEVQEPSIFPESTNPDSPPAEPPAPDLERQLTAEEIKTIDQELLENIREIQLPEERVLALVRASRYKTALKEYDVAKRALDEAARAVGQIQEPLRRDLRVIAVIEQLVRLADEVIKESLSNTTYYLLQDEATIAPAKRLELASLAYDLTEEAGRLTRLIGRGSYASEAYFKMAESGASLSRQIGEAAIISGDRRADLEPINKELRDLADRFLAQASTIAWENQSGPWRDRGLVGVVGSAADSGQYARALSIASGIPTPEVRAEGMIRVAEAEARRGDTEGATRAYSLAASAVASVHIADLRATLADVLIDSLIASGRFADARRSIVLYPDAHRQLEALGAVARSMGARGKGDAAREWIDREVARPYRDLLLREVNDGVLSSLQNYRAETFLGGPRR